jgi:squamous cell carcinoma antigen recognized by T-cells 3
VCSRLRLNNKSYIFVCVPEKIEPNKIFVKGLPLDITKDELDKLFSTHGAIKDIRLVMHRSGTPKGLAYVEYVNEKDAQKAVLKMDQTALRGFTVSCPLAELLSFN